MDTFSIYIIAMMTFFLCAVGYLIITSTDLARTTRTKPDEVVEMDKDAVFKELRALAGRHETASSLLELFEKEGAGSWPPKANHDSWPLALRPYKDIYLEVGPLLPAAEPSLDDNVNHSRRNKYRSLMRNLLRERINIDQVKDILAAAEAGNWDVLPRDAYNGFYGCIAVCRHAYRWATIPVVKVAQNEKIVDFPPELDVPWPYLQRNFGVTAESGNNTANVLHNFNEKGERVYKINVGMSELIRSSEEVFFRMFHTLEVLAFPIYYEMVQSVVSYEVGDKDSCVKHLENVTLRLRNLLLVFYENLHNGRVSRSVWLSYVQGFQGWGVGRMVDGEFIKYDGLSGNHVLFFQALDAFLGMDRYLTDENMIRYIPIKQRELCLTFRKHSLQSKLKAESDPRIAEEMNKIVNRLKLFRSAHRTRVMPYLQQPAPERLMMTAGKSVLQDPTSKDVDSKNPLESLDQMLAKRFEETTLALRVL